MISHRSRQDPSLKLAGNSNTNIRFIGFNLTKEPFDNLKVRQAIAAVVDREAMLGPTVFGYGTPTEVLFPPDFWAALQQEVRPPDVERAKELMAEAGHADGFSTTITSWSQYSFLSNAAVVLQEQLRQIGIEAELNLVENATMVRAGLRPSDEGLRNRRNRRERLRRSQYDRPALLQDGREQ